MIRPDGPRVPVSTLPNIGYDEDENDADVLIERMDEVIESAPLDPAATPDLLTR